MRSGVREAMLTINSSSRQPARELCTREQLREARADALRYSLGPSILSGNDEHLESYIAFCDLHSFPYDPTLQTLCRFIVYTAHYVGPRPIPTYLSSICNGLEDVFPEVRKTCKHRLVTRILKGCVRIFNASQRIRPITLDHLLTFSRAYPLSSHDDLLFLALVSCGFFALHRLRELVDEDDPTQRSYFNRILRSTVFSSENHICYILPAHKTKGRVTEGCSISISHIPDLPFDPFSIFHCYLRSRDTLAPYCPYLWLDSRGMVPTRSWFLHRLHSLLPVGRHSLRLGGATFFASQGWSGARIQAFGRWASEDFEFYTQKHPPLLHALTPAASPASFGPIPAAPV